MRTLHGYIYTTTGERAPLTEFSMRINAGEQTQLVFTVAEIRAGETLDSFLSAFTAQLHRSQFMNVEVDLLTGSTAGLLPGRFRSSLAVKNAELLSNTEWLNRDNYLEGAREVRELRISADLLAVNTGD